MEQVNSCEIRSAGFLVVFDFCLIIFLLFTGKKMKKEALNKPIAVS